MTRMEIQPRACLGISDTGDSRANHSIFLIQTALSRLKWGENGQGWVLDESAVEVAIRIEFGEMAAALRGLQEWLKSTISPP